MKQLTIRVEGFVTVTVPEGTDVNDIPMKIDVGDAMDCDDSPVDEVVDTEITLKELSAEVDL